jgi:predicted permease
MAFRDWLRRRRFDEADFEEEIRSHLAIAARERMEDGADEGTARFASRKDFGNVTLATEAARRIWRPRWVDVASDIVTDARYALRRLRSAPGFTLFAAATLALGIGATTAIYSAVDTVFRPPFMRDIDRVVNIYHSRPFGASGPMMWVSWPDYEDLKSGQTRLEHLTAWTRFRHAVTARGRTELIMGELVEGEYFPLVGVRPALGRLLTPADDQPNAPPVVVMGYAFWQTWFGGDPAVIGETVRIGGELFDVVGVVQPEFRGVDMPKIAPTPLWIPLSAGLRLDPGLAEGALNRERRQFWVKGRMRPDGSLEEVRAEIAAVAAALDSTEPIGRGLPPAAGAFQSSRPWFVMPAGDVRLHESADIVVAPVAIAVMAAVVLVLLVACTNLANLMLARTARARHEVAVQVALGASRARVIRSQLIEGALLALAGGAGAVLVARALMTVLGSPIRIETLTVQLDPQLNLPVLVAAAAATLLTLVVFGLVPAWLSTRGHVRAALYQGGRASIRWRGRAGLIAAQVTVSTVLIGLAFLCVQQVRATGRHDFGADLDRFAAARIDFARSGYDEPRARAFLDEAVQALRLRPGVARVAIASTTPHGMSLSSATLVPVDAVSEARLDAELIAGTEEMFTTFGIEIRRGRGFDVRDARDGDPVAVIDETAARRLFGTVDPLGRRVEIRRRSFVGEPDVPPATVTIVGIAEALDAEALGRSQRFYVYRPWAQEYASSVALVARTAGDPSALVDPLRRVVAGMDPGVVVLDAATGTTLARADNLVARVTGVLTGLLGGLALLLSLVGLSGVLSQIVTSRTHEIGVRMALGAQARRLAGMIVRQGLLPVAAGVATGFGLWIAVAVLLRGYGPYLALTMVLPTFDPLALAVVPVTLLVAGAAACYVPARRAARVNPVVALRQE